MKWHQVPSPLMIAENSPNKAKQANRLTFSSIIQQAAEEDSISPSKTSTNKMQSSEMHQLTDKLKSSPSKVSYSGSSPNVSATASRVQLLKKQAAQQPTEYQVKELQLYSDGVLHWVEM